MKNNILKIKPPEFKEKYRQEIIKQGFWFVDVPRTSSSSIRYELSNNFSNVNGKEGFLPEDSQYSHPTTIEVHRTAKIIRHFVGVREWDKLFTFGFIRNPYMRVWSMYCYHIKVDKLRRGETFKDFIKSLTTFRGNGLISPSSFTMLSDNRGRIIVDRVCKFEDRENEIKFLEDRLQMKFGGVVSQSASTQYGKCIDHYDDVTKKMVEEIYVDDFNLGKYSLNIPDE